MAQVNLIGKNIISIPEMEEEQMFTSMENTQEFNILYSQKKRADKPLKRKKNYLCKSMEVILQNKENINCVKKSKNESNKMEKSAS